MMRIIESFRLRWIWMVILCWTFAGWYAGAMGQEGSPSVPQADALPGRPFRPRMPTKSCSIASSRWSNVSTR